MLQHHMSTPHAQADAPVVSRRQAAMTGLVALIAATQAAPANAIFGLGGNAEEKYASETVCVADGVSRHVEPQHMYQHK